MPDTAVATHIYEMLNDIESEGPFGYFVDDDIPGQYHFCNGITSAHYTFTLSEIIDVWKELNL